MLILKRTWLLRTSLNELVNNKRGHYELVNNELVNNARGDDELVYKGVIFLACLNTPKVHPKKYYLRS